MDRMTDACENITFLAVGKYWNRPESKFTCNSQLDENSSVDRTDLIAGVIGIHYPKQLALYGM